MTKPLFVTASSIYTQSCLYSSLLRCCRPILSTLVSFVRFSAVRCADTVTRGTLLIRSRVHTSQNIDTTTRPDKEYECFFWRRNGFCKFSDDDCVYAHCPTGKVKEYIDAKDKANYVKAYKNANSSAPKQECFYWTQGTCRFSDDKCLFAHYHVNLSSDQPEWRERGRDQYPPDSFYPEKAMITYPAKLADKQLECYYWRHTSFCKYTEDECLYAHHPTGRVKEIPGMPKSMEIYRDSPETRYAPEIKRPEKNSPKAIKGFTSYAMPEKSAMKLSELTLSAFHDLFCYTNPTARKDRPWEALLISYKDYITKHFGKETLKHIIAAYTRVLSLRHSYEQM